jgi:hypothetical protein
MVGIGDGRQDVAQVGLDLRLAVDNLLAPQAPVCDSDVALLFHATPGAIWTHQPDPADACPRGAEPVLDLSRRLRTRVLE